MASFEIEKQTCEKHWTRCQDSNYSYYRTSTWLLYFVALLWITVYIYIYRISLKTKALVHVELSHKNLKLVANLEIILQKVRIPLKTQPKPPYFKTFEFESFLYMLYFYCIQNQNNVKNLLDGICTEQLASYTKAIFSKNSKKFFLILKIKKIFWPYKIPCFWCRQLNCFCTAEKLKANGYKDREPWGQ